MSGAIFGAFCDVVRQIPAGTVATYGQIARLAGMPRCARLVGYAMAACSDPAVPCHRVVDRFGGTKAAFDRLAPGTQRALLEAEGVPFRPDGTVDLPEKTCRDLDIVVASIHPPCYGLDHTREENTRAYVEVMKKPYVNIIGHPDDGRFPFDYETIVRTAKETGTLLEINNSSMRPQSSRKGTRENILTMLDLCRQYEVPVTTGSDAHVDVDAGNFTNVREMLDYCNFPEELVITTDWDRLKEFLGIR